MSKLVPCLVLALVAPLAQAAEVPDWSGDIAFFYGRNFGQKLNVTGIAGEFKRNLHPQFALGVRVGASLGVSVSEKGGAKAYTGSPLLLKAEGFPSAEPTRPFLGVGVGVTPYAAGGVAVVTRGDNVSTQAYAAKGPNFTVMPELGIDLGQARISVSHGFLIGSVQAVRASLGADSQGTTSTTVEYEVNGLGSTLLQIGGHFGGPQEG